MGRLLILFLLLLPAGAGAHDPVFGLGPHVLFRNAVEIHMSAAQQKAGADRGTATLLQVGYGITANWSASLGLPYVRLDGSQQRETGRGPTRLASKYRFWRKDRPGVQESVSVLGKVVFDDAGVNGLDRKGNDYLAGLAYGYESRRWYRWAAVRHRFNSNAAGGAKRPDVWLVDLVGGIRFMPTEYTEPDWVWMLELNGELADKAVAGSGRQIGGNQWFLSPGLMWTRRNIAIKTGVQIPVYNNLASDQAADDYRAVLEFELHL